MKDHLLAHREQCPQLTFTRSHIPTEKDWQAKGFRTVAILRSPADRFRSAFDYAAGGSEKYAKTDMQQLAAKFKSANDFADSLRASEHKKDGLAWKIVLHREGGTQFREASHWLNGDATKREVVCYSDSLAEDLSRAVNSKQAGGGQTKCAIKTGKRNVSKKHSSGLNAVNAAWVERYYKADLSLYRRYCGYSLLPSLLSQGNRSAG